MQFEPRERWSAALICYDLLLNGVGGQAWLVLGGPFYSLLPPLEPSPPVLFEREPESPYRQLPPCRDAREWSNPEDFRRYRCSKLAREGKLAQRPSLEWSASRAQSIFQICINISINTSVETRERVCEQFLDLSLQVLQVSSTISYTFIIDYTVYIYNNNGTYRTFDGAS